MSTSLKSSDPKLETCRLASASLMACFDSSFWFRLFLFGAVFLANDSVAYLEHASKNSFLMNSLTSTRSGA